PESHGIRRQSPASAAAAAGRGVSCAGRARTRRTRPDRIGGFASAHRNHESGIHQVKRILSHLLIAMLSVALLSGCSYLRTKFGAKNDAYKKSAQSRPLEVPPDLDSPNRSGTLQI